MAKEKKSKPVFNERHLLKKLRSVKRFMEVYFESDSDVKNNILFQQSSRFISEFIVKLAEGDERSCSIAFNALKIVHSSVNSICLHQMVSQEIAPLNIPPNKAPSFQASKELLISSEWTIYQRCLDKLVGLVGLLYNTCFQKQIDIEAESDDDSDPESEDETNYGVCKSPKTKQMLAKTLNLFNSKQSGGENPSNLESKSESKSESKPELAEHSKEVVSTTLREPAGHSNEVVSTTLREPENAVILFSRSKCPHSQKFSKIWNDTIKELEKRYPEITFSEVAADEDSKHMEAAAKSGVKHVPSIVIWRKGKRQVIAPKKTREEFEKQLIDIIT